MRRNVAFVVAALLLVSIASISISLAAVHHDASHHPAVRASANRDADREPADRRTNHKLLFRLLDHGSTNTPAWVLSVFTDGSGALTHDKRGNVNGNKTFKVGTFDVQALQAALGKLDLSRLPRCSPAGAIAPVEMNLGSVSFGSSATLDYRGRLVRSFCLDNHLETVISGELARIVAQAHP